MLPPLILGVVNSFTEPHRWCSGQRACLECSSLWLWDLVGSNQRQWN